MTGPAGPHGGFALCLAAVLLCLALPASAARIVAAQHGKSWAQTLRDMLLCASFGAAAFFLVGSWLTFGADAGGILGLPPGASHPAPQADTLGAALFFLYHLGLCLVPFWMFYAVSGARLTRAGNALMCAVVCVFVFPVIGHWTIGYRWLGASGAGWLAARGFFDAAGGVAALGCGAAAALAGMLGGAAAGSPRDGAPTGDDSATTGGDGAAPEGSGAGWQIMLVSWLLASAFSAGSSGGNFFGALAALIMGCFCGALAAKTVAVAAQAGASAGLHWLVKLFRSQNRDFVQWLGNLGPDEAVGLAAGAAALSSGLTVAPWWAIPAIGALAGSLAWISLEFLGVVLGLTPLVRRVLALGLGGAIGAAFSGLVALPQPSLFINDMFVAGGVTLAGIELTGAAATAAWTIAVVWLVQRGLLRAQRALAALPEE
jgi:ammonia channel protein AmtB